MEKQQSPERAAAQLSQLANLADKGRRSLDALNLLLNLSNDPAYPMSAQQQQRLTALSAQRAAAGNTAPVEIGGEEGAVLSIDERVMGKLPLNQSLFLSEGTHCVTLAKEGNARHHLLRVYAYRPMNVRFSPSAWDLYPRQTPAFAVPLQDDTLPPPLRNSLIESVRSNAPPALVMLPKIESAHLLASPPALEACIQNQACHEKISDEMDYVLTLAVSPQDAATSMQQVQRQYSARALHVQVGELAAAQRGECTCTLAEAIAKLGPLAGAVLDEAQNRESGKLVLLSQPPGAKVAFVAPLATASASTFIAGAQSGELGTTPIRRSLFVGTYDLMISYSEYVSQQQQIVITNGAELTRDLVLQPIPKTPIYKRWWFWQIVSTAAVAAAGGTTAGVLASRRNF